jgi:hypothetical protein
MDACLFLWLSEFVYSRYGTSSAFLFLCFLHLVFVFVTPPIRRLLTGSRTTNELEGGGRGPATSAHPTWGWSKLYDESMYKDDLTDNFPLVVNNNRVLFVNALITYFDY